MNFLLGEEATIEYITPNQSFSEILRKKLIGRSGFVEIRSLFKGSASYNPETHSLEVKPENFKDKGARPAKPKGKYEVDPLDQLVRNTYKTLMTRGMKRCFVYCVDKELAYAFSRK